MDPIGEIPSGMSEQSQAGGGVELAPGVWVDPGEVRYAYARSGGPGGQAVNKVATKAQLRVRVGAIRGLSDAARGRLRRLAGRRLTDDDEVLVQADTHRSQLDNRAACLERLRDLVRRAVSPPKPRKKTRPSRAAKQKRLDVKKRRGELKKRRRDVD